MMDRLPALPLIVNDPYFSIWMPGDTLTDTNTTHWAGAVKPLRGGITVDGKRFHWLGAASNPTAETLSVQVTPTQTSSTLLAAGAFRRSHHHRLGLSVYGFAPGLRRASGQSSVLYAGKHRHRCAFLRHDPSGL